MRIIYISDIHGNLEAIDKLPEADLLLVGGDFVTLGSEQDVRNAIACIEKKYPGFLAVSGNMDPKNADDILLDTGHLVSIRQEEGDEVSSQSAMGLRIFGFSGGNRSPFNSPNEWDEDEAAPYFAKLAEGKVDILLTHAPAFDSGADKISNGASVGSKILAETVARVKPMLHLCGHIHEAAGIYQVGNTITVNPGQFGKEGNYADIRIDKDSKPSVWLAKAL